MSTSTFVESSSFSAIHGQFRQPSVGHDAAAAAGRMGAESAVRFRGLVGLALAALVDTKPDVEELLPAPATLAWENGTLPGVMAGGRPAVSTVWCCGTLPGTMAGIRPAASPIRRMLLGESRG